MDKIEAIHPDIGAIAIINLEATWLPNAILEGVLKTNQEKHPTTIFVKDYNKEFVKLWNLPDDSYVVMVFNENGERIFIKDGKLNIKEQKKVIDLLMGK
jgi:predicted transcriptional regulator